MIFTITAQFLEQLILKYTIIAIEKTITLPFWIGNKIYNYYYQPQIKDIQKLRQEILQIQKELAQAELEIAKERAKGLAPEIISAIENYNKALDVTADRNEEIKDKQQELSDATVDLNFDLAENAERYDEIAAKFPNFKEQVKEIAGMIGIPDEMLTAALDSMDKSVTEFINYVDYARRFRDKVISGEAAGADWTQGQEGVQSWKDSDAWRSMNTYETGDRTKPLPIDPNIIPKNMPSEPDETEKPWWKKATDGLLKASTWITDPSSRNIPEIDVVGSVKDFFTPQGPSYPQPHINVKQPQGQQFPLYNPGESTAIKDFFSGITMPEIDYDPSTSTAISDFFKGINTSYIPYSGRAYGGNVPIGRASVVGEMGPEVIMSTPGGTSVFSNKTGGGYGGITVENMNVNITGLPADPISARKAAINIRKELTKLEKEGNAGTGLRNR